MTCCGGISCCGGGAGGWIGKALLIVLIGSVIGFADSKLRPVQLTRGTPPALPTNVPPVLPPTNTDPVSPTPADSGTPTPTPPVEAAKLPDGHITIPQAKALFDQQAQFIDSRKQSEYEAGHVEGSIRLELASFKDGDPPVMSLLDRAGVIVVYCAGGNCDESEAVARMLDASGFKKVYVMHDGFPGWKDAGHPIETGEGVQ